MEQVPSVLLCSRSHCREFFSTRSRQGSNLRGLLPPDTLAGCCRRQLGLYSSALHKAPNRTRTCDRSLTKRLLYQLSYKGMMSVQLFEGAL